MLSDKAAGDNQEDESDDDDDFDDDEEIKEIDIRAKSSGKRQKKSA